MKKKIIKHIINQGISRFMGFVMGLWASRLTATFFDKKNAENLWGLTAEKTVLNSENYNMIEMIISVMIGFCVLLIVDFILESKKHIVLLEKIQKHSPIIVYETKRYLILSQTYVKTMYYKFKGNNGVS